MHETLSPCLLYAVLVWYLHTATTLLLKYLLIGENSLYEIIIHLIWLWCNQWSYLIYSFVSIIEMLIHWYGRNILSFVCDFRCSNICRFGNWIYFQFQVNNSPCHGIFLEKLIIIRLPEKFSIKELVLYSMSIFTKRSLQF